MPDGPKPTQDLKLFEDKKDDEKNQNNEEPEDNSDHEEPPPKFTVADDMMLTFMKDEIINARSEKQVYRMIEKLVSIWDFPL